MRLAIRGESLLEHTTQLRACFPFGCGPRPSLAKAHEQPAVVGERAVRIEALRWILRLRSAGRFVQEIAAKAVVQLLSVDAVATT